MRHLLFVGAICMSLTWTALAQLPGAQTGSDQPSTPPAYEQTTPTQEQDIHQNLKDLHFAFDRYDLTPEDRQSLQETANWLKTHPRVYVVIAGDADERGTIVYNLYLSDERAKAARDAVVAMGVPESQIVFATGWGKLYPVCNQAEESCWAENRRAHFEPWQAGSLTARGLSLPPAAESARDTGSATSPSVR